MSNNCTKATRTAAPFTDVGVSVQSGTKRTDRIIEVQRKQVLEATLFVEELEHRLGSGLRRHVVTSCRDVTCVETEAYPFRGLHTGANETEVREVVAEVRSRAGGGLQTSDR